MGAAGSIPPSEPQEADDVAVRRSKLLRTLTSGYVSSKSTGVDDAEMVKSIDARLQQKASQLWEQLEEIAQLQGQPVGNKDDPTALEVMCSDLVSRAAHLASQSFLLAADESDNCLTAFHVALELMRGDDTIQIVHVDDESNWSTIKSRFEGSLVTKLLPSRYSFNLLPQEGSVKNTVIKYTNTAAQNISSFQPEASIFVSGFIGKRSQDGHASVMGSTTDLALRAIHVPCMIVKKELPPDADRTWYLLADGSDRCFQAYKIVIQTLLRPRDTIKVVHFYEVDAQPTLEYHLTVAGIEEKYTKDMMSRGILGEFESIDWVPTTPMLTMILDYLKEGGPDFVALAPRAASLQERNSMTESLICNAHFNFFLVKR